MILCRRVGLNKLYFFVLLFPHVFTNAAFTFLFSIFFVNYFVFYKAVFLSYYINEIKNSFIHSFTFVYVVAGVSFQDARGGAVELKPHLVDVPLGFIVGLKADE